MAAQQVPSLPEAGDVIHHCRRQDRECGARLSHGGAIVTGHHAPPDGLPSSGRAWLCGARHAATGISAFRLSEPVRGIGRRPVALPG